MALIESETFRLGIEFIIFLTPKPRSRKSYPVRPTSRQITPNLRGVVPSRVYNTKNHNRFAIAVLHILSAKILPTERPASIIELNFQPSIVGRPPDEY